MEPNELEMEPRWEHATHEDAITTQWEESGYANPDTCIEKGITDATAPVFSMVLPPANVTGTLHMGHAARITNEDIMVRYARMNGKRTVWIPGTDHAAIATQSKVEGIIYKEEGKNRHDFSREEFLDRVKDFAQKSHDTIVGQVKKMGASVDWSREAFTLDDQRNLAVRTAFKKMYDDGLIEQDFRIVNWDPKGQTTISDDEIVHQERDAMLYTFKYSADFPIAISTTRPETKVGDVAVAVHPNDARYTKYIGQKFSFTFVDVPVEITIVADESVDPEFGTGALGVTPAHSTIDWEIAKRNNVPFKQVINEYAKMSVEGQLKGKKVTEAREIIVSWLKEQGLLEKEEKITQNVATAERSGAIIEPLPKLQWFVKVNKEFTIPHSKIPTIASGSTTTLKKIMRAAIESGTVKIIPDNFEKIYYHWIDNLRDWCISRQIWYGHQIPVWYKKTNTDSELQIANSDTRNAQEIFVGIEKPEGNEWIQDSDTLDTWFSSGLWTFSTLGWPFDSAQGKPSANNDLNIYHPTSVLETGSDILFFWVARMILMTGYLLGDIPFKTVYLAGLVRDGQGRKMSKSLGNIIDPLTMIEKYGTDATRMSLVVGATAGTDIKLSEDKVRGYRNFATKIWNAARFVLLKKPEGYESEKTNISPNDEKIIAELKEVKKTVGTHIEQFQFHLAAETAYHYFWHTFADVIIENAKPRLTSTDATDAHHAYKMLETVLTQSLIMLHPFVPFVTEAVYQKLHPKKLLMVEKWEE